MLVNPEIVFAVTVYQNLISQFLLRIYHGKKIFVCTVQNDPEERRDLSTEEEEKVEELKDRVMEYFEDLIPRFADQDDNVRTSTA